MTCTDKTCQHELKECLSHIKKDYLRKPQPWLATLLITTFFAVTTTTVATGYKLIFGQEVAQYQYAKKEDCATNTQDIKVVKESIKRIDVNITDIKSQMQNQKKDMDKNIDEIKHMLRSIQRDNRGGRD